MNATIKTIANRYARLLWKSPTNTIEQVPMELEGGYWVYPDLDCTTEETAVWDGEKYLRRLFERILSHRNDPEEWEISISAFRFWLHRDFRNPNWWHNEIGTPAMVAKLMFLCGERLNADDMEKGLAIVRRGSMSTNPDIADGWWTAANLIWGAVNTVREALLTGDENLLRQAVKRAGKEIVITPADASDGIKPDGSFFQHGPLLYTGGYGRSFVQEISEVVFVLSGTNYQFTTDQLRAIATHVLDGQRELSHHGVFYHNAVGREYVRPTALYLNQGKRSMLLALQCLSQTAEFPRKIELEGFLGECEGKNNDYKNDKFFSVARYLSHRRPAYSIGIMGNGKNIRCAEICNNENKLGYNLACGGTLCLMEKGDEYAEIIPAWDYAMLPGTTAYYESDEELCTHGEWDKEYASDTWENTCYGAASKGLGAMYLIRKKEGISSRTLCITCDGGLFLLKNSICAEDHGHPVFSTINQCRADCPVTEAGEPIVGERKVPAGRCVRNGGFTYRWLDGGEMLVRREARLGDWRRNEPSAEPEDVPCQVFTLCIPHGFSCENASFALSVAHESDHPSAFGITNLVNTTEVCALEFANGRGAVYLQAGATYTTATGKVFTQEGLHLL